MDGICANNFFKGFNGKCAKGFFYNFDLPVIDANVFLKYLLGLVTLDYM